jgi:chondroitin 4-sulfotransferase 11
MINSQYSCIFIHVPKTAGTSVLDWFDDKLKSRVEAHWVVYDTSKFMDYYTFTFVRNPWDRFVSEYEWRVQRSPWGRRRKDISFNECCKAFAKNELDVLYRPKQRIHLWNQLNVIEHAVGSIKNVNYIGRFENIEYDFNIICDEIGMKHKKLPHINKTKRNHYTEYYDDVTKQIVAEKYAKDIEYFGYEFGE